MNSLIVFVAKYFFIISVVTVALYWIKTKRQVKFDLGWQLVLGGILAVLLATVGGHLYYDTRPFVSHHMKPLFPHAPDNGFPSDHALLTSFLGFVTLKYSRGLGLLSLLVAVLVGAARVAAHIHRPIDIVGSFVFAGIAVFVTQVLRGKWRKGRRAGPIR